MIENTAQYIPCDRPRQLPTLTEKAKVLIVEDEEELIDVLEYNLLRQGYEVLIARDGLEACRQIGAKKPDLILLDLLLPLLDGWEVCSMVRSHQEPTIAGTPIIILSALGATDDRIRGYDLGADLCLPKPYSVREVMIKTRQLIEQHRNFLRLTKSICSLRQQTSLQDNWQQALFHELRNQLAIISTLAEILRQPAALPEPEQSAKYADQIIDNTQFLGTLAENYLLVREVEKDHQFLDAEPLVLHQLLAEILQVFTPLAEKKACDLELNCPRELMLDSHPVSVKIILSTLLDNALKYSPLDGNVTLSATMNKEQIIMMVEDDGPRIPTEEQEKIFEKFYRGSTAKNTAPGHGLGLYMARILARAMGGDLQLTTGEFPGSCFALTLPAQRPAVVDSTRS